MRRVEPVLHGEPRRLHRRGVGVGGDADRLADDDRAAPERQAEARPVPGLKSMRRLVTTAIGTIGRPEMRASVTMPSPATRATFGTSAVMAMVAPASSCCASAMSALAPPFSRTLSPRAPEPRTGSTPSRRSATACRPASPWRETIAHTCAMFGARA